VDKSQRRYQPTWQPDPVPSVSDDEKQIALLKNRIARLETIFDNIPEAVIVTDLEGQPVYFNRKAEAYIGVKPGNIQPAEWPEKFGFFLDDEKTPYPGKHMPLARALQGETVQAEEMILHPKDEQSSMWISMSAQSLNDEKGDITGAIVVFRDISYRKQVEISREKHAKHTEALYTISRSIAELGNDLDQIMNAVTVHTSNFIGDACIATLITEGADRPKIVAMHHPNPDARALLRELTLSSGSHLQSGIIDGVIQSGEPLLIPSLNPQQLEAILLPEFARYAHEVGIHSILIAPINGRNGILGTLGLSRDRSRKPYTADDQSLLLDIAQRTALAIEHGMLFNSLRAEISERHMAEKALEQSETRFRSIFESTTLGIKVLDLDGNILQTNHAFQQMVGYPENELVGSHFVQFVHPLDATRTQRFFENIKSKAIPDFRLEHRLVNKDDSVVWVNASFTGVKQSDVDDSLAFIVGITENITERKRIEYEMTEMKGRLQTNVEIERLRLAQELHDGPMQELYSAIYQIESLRGTLENQEKDTLENVKQNLQKVLQELRSTAKELRPPTIASFGLEKAIRSHVEDFQEKYPDLNIRLFLAQDRQLLPENVRLALFRIYQHSMANVARHSQANEARVRFTFDAEEARLEITDNGKGFTVPRNWVSLARQGHYGLAGAAERVQALGGTFTVESQSGHGTSVQVVIPISESSEKSENKFLGVTDA
jgi:PAS domain S-box-containing protein